MAAEDDDGSSSFGVAVERKRSEIRRVHSSLVTPLLACPIHRLQFLSSIQLCSRTATKFQTWIHIKIGIDLRRHVETFQQGWDYSPHCGAHSSAIRLSKDLQSAVGGILISKPASASDGCKFITNP
ncbi:hypothetical protein G4B88_000480 [Cannabis sativa]|uniref:Uncharacterized protein n=1 Tax=Cannabis sativa TaxID=3483 RepID=A0A7J6EPN0_CANSA|nr:hypothetical protein G4B88_000480 [Cannabis sativa]